MNDLIIVFDAPTLERQKAIVRASIRDMARVAEHRRRSGVRRRLEFLQRFNTQQLERLNRCERLRIQATYSDDGQFGRSFVTRS